MTKPAYEVAYHWTRSGATGWTTLGHAFKESDGRITIHLNAHPIAEIETQPGKLVLFVAEEKKAKS